MKPLIGLPGNSGRRTMLQLTKEPFARGSPAQPRLDSLERIAPADAFFTAADIRSGGNTA
jgi:hypothetical protein